MTETLVTDLPRYSALARKLLPDWEPGTHTVPLGEIERYNRDGGALMVTGYCLVAPGWTPYAGDMVWVEIDRSMTEQQVREACEQAKCRRLMATNRFSSPDAPHRA